MFDSFPVWIQIPNPPGSSTGQAGDVPVFHSGVDCPANVWSAIRSCPNIAAWMFVIGLGGFLAGLYLARK